MQSEQLQLNTNLICKYCNIEKLQSEFRLNRKKCKDCEKAYGRKYAKDNIHIRQNWVQQNQETMQQLQQQWYLSNKSKIRQKEQQRTQNDIQFKQQRKCRQIIRDLLKGKLQSSHFEMNSVDLRKWIQSQFTEQMNWENYNTYWTIDHVYPLSIFNMDDSVQQVLANNWRNLKPLSKKQNMTKKAKIDTTAILQQEQSLHQYYIQNNIEKSDIDDKYIEIQARHLINRETLNSY